MRISPASVNADAFKGLASQRHLYLNHCFALENVDGLKGLATLTGLDLNGCSALKSVEPLKRLAALEVLILGRCTNLPPEEVSALGLALPRAIIEYP